MFFKRNPKYLEMKYTQLATAIEYESTIDFYKGTKNLYRDKRYGYIYDVIDVDDHIHIVIKHYHYTFESSWSIVLHYISCHTKMYLDGICVNQYEFEKELRQGYTTTDIWMLDSKKIYHKIPNEVIQKINDWSEQVVNRKMRQKELQKKKKDEEKQKKFFQEESQLQETYKNYKM